MIPPEHRGASCLTFKSLLALTGLVKKIYIKAMKTKGRGEERVIFANFISITNPFKHEIVPSKCYNASALSKAEHISASFISTGAQWITNN